MTKKKEVILLKLVLVCVSAFAVFTLIYKLKKDQKKTNTNTMNTMKNGKYTNNNSLAAINHNPTNIIKTSNKWQGETESPPILAQSGRSTRFKAFESDYYGILAAFNNLKSYFNKGYNTVRTIISRWAPPSENNTDNYIINIAKKMGVGVDTVLDFNKNSRDLIKEIAAIESGFKGDEIIIEAFNSIS